MEPAGRLHRLLGAAIAGPVALAVGVGWLDEAGVDHTALWLLALLAVLLLVVAATPPVSIVATR